MKSDKQFLREHFLAVRSAIDADTRKNASEQALASLLEFDSRCPSKTLFIYMDFRSEFPTGGFIDAWLGSGRTVAVPRVEGNDIVFYFISSSKDLERGSFGILEPVSGCLRADGDDCREGIVLVPGLAFSSDGARLGYGAGYYDRYLKCHKFKNVIGLCFEVQIADGLPLTPYDVPMEMLLTERGLRKCPAR